MDINILMTTDKNYISQARVAIWSMRKFTDMNTKLIITVLCSKELDQCSKNRLYVLENEFNNLAVKFYEINEIDFAQAYGRGCLPVAAYYRLVAAEVLQIDKCIYLDCDLIVNLDLNELYKIDISNFYFGGVVDLNLISHPNLAYSYMRECNMKDFSDYINTGVLLMNLDLMRKDHIVKKFLEEMIQGNNLWLDQDVINRICHGKILLIDWTFNHIIGHSNEEYIWQFGETKRPQRGEIYHWAGCYESKAWNNYLLCQAKLWWDIAKEALEPEVYQKYYYTVNNYVKRFYFYEIVEKCKGYEKIVIVGYSDNGVRVMYYLRRYGINGEIIFCDNDSIKGQMKIINHNVISVEEAVLEYKNAIWINAIQKARNEVNEQIKKLGISENQILQYYQINTEYFLNLDEKYKEKGIKEKIFLENKK